MENGIPHTRIWEYLGQQEVDNEHAWEAFQLVLDHADAILANIYDMPKVREFGPYNLLCWSIRRQFETDIFYFQAFDRIIREHCVEELVLIGHHINGLDESYEGRPGLSNSFETFERVLATLSDMHDIPFRTKIEYLESLPGCVENESPKLPAPQLRCWENVDAPIGSTAFLAQTGWGIKPHAALFGRCLSNGHGAWHNSVSKRDAPTFPVVPAHRILQGADSAIGQLNDLFGMNVRTLLQSRFEACEDLPGKIIADALRWREYFRDERVSHVFSANLTDIRLMPMRLPCMWDGSPISVIVRHGDDLISISKLKNLELKFSHIHICNDSLSTHYYEKEAKKMRHEVQCIANPTHLLKLRGELFAPAERLPRSLKSWCNRLHVAGAKAKQKIITRIKRSQSKKIVYIPLFSPSHHIETDISDPEMPLKYLIQLYILQFLNELEGVETVFKALPSQKTDSHPLHYPMLRIIKERFPNVRISNEPSYKELSDAAVCLMDAPSTALFEALVMGVPTRCLVYRKLRLRQDRLAQYSQFLTYFDTPEEIPALLADTWKKGDFNSTTPSKLGIGLQSFSSMAQLLGGGGERPREFNFSEPQQKASDLMHDSDPHKPAVG